MKRKAILIANTDGLPGAKKDINSICKFLISFNGGNWLESEIKNLTNPTKKDLLSNIEFAKAEKNDFVFLHFSGHGGQDIHSVRLEINENGEYISDTDLFEIAPRQVSIFDCCRVSLTANMEARAALILDEAYRNSRAHYERLIMSAAKQQLKLYGCSKEEVANEDANGGYYTQRLLRSALNVNESGHMTFNEAHKSAEILVRKITNNEQNPEIVSGRHLSSQNLVISMS